jgi:hypothetical protein
VAIPLLLIGFLVVSSKRRAGEHPATETDADRERTEREFAEAEGYQETWREQTHGEVSDERFP